MKNNIFRNVKWITKWQSVNKKIILSQWEICDFHSNHKIKNLCLNKQILRMYKNIINNKQVIDYK